MVVKNEETANLKKRGNVEDKIKLIYPDGAKELVDTSQVPQHMSDAK